jgi:tetratricopeptide (TPR) repeat protein
VGADICHRHLEAHLAAHGKRLIDLPCAGYHDPRQVTERLFALEPEETWGGIWLGAVIPDSDPEIRLWKEAWWFGLASLNQQRNPLFRHLPCPLVLVGAPWLNPLLREAAPDLWSRRAAVVQITPAPERSPVSGALPVQTAEAVHRLQLDDAADDPDYALEYAEHLRGQSASASVLAPLLLRAGNGFYNRTRLEPAERCLREAATLFEPLAHTSSEMQAAWAAALGNLSSCLSGLGKREEALAKAEEALRIYGQLARDRPDAFLPDLAMSLNNLANSLSNLGKREEALAKAEEAVRIYEQLAQDRPDAFLPDLAMSLNNLANHLSNLDRREAALAKAEEAVWIYGQLARDRPDALLPGLAGSLNNLANSLSDLGRREEALAKTEEAVRIYRQLTQDRSDAFLPGLAVSLKNLANHLSNLGKREEALAGAEEALRICGQLARDRPDAFLPSLAGGYGMQGVVLYGMGRHAEAADSFADGIRALTPLFQKTPAAHAQLMENLCREYREAVKQAGQPPDMALIAPVLAVFEQLEENAPQTPGAG